MPRHPDRQISVSVDWLAKHLPDANLRIMDARFVPPTDAHPRGDALYAAGHIPGAIFVHWRQDLATNAPPVPNLLLDAEAFADKMGGAGWMPRPPSSSMIRATRTGPRVSGGR